jgi:hypothetical protein
MSFLYLLSSKREERERDREGQTEREIERVDLPFVIFKEGR